MTPKTETNLLEFGLEIQRIAKTNGTPEAVITTTVRPVAEASTATPKLEQAIVHRLRAMGFETGLHERFEPSIDAEPTQLGCERDQIAVELEAVFRHLILE